MWLWIGKGVRERRKEVYKVVVIYFKYELGYLLYCNDCS